MGNLINNILTLGNKEKYMVLNQAVYQNKNYYLVVQVSENEEEVLGKFKFLEETEVDGEKAVAVVKDEKIIELLELLDPLKLPLDNVQTIKGPNDREMELASSREVYYQDLTKAYEKTRQFEKAYTLCDKALNENSKWHN